MKLSIKSLSIALCINTMLMGSISGSFESTLENWEPGQNVQLNRLSIKDGIPALSVTDDQYCLQIKSDSKEKWMQLAVQKNWSQEIKTSGLLSFDIFIPGHVLPPDGWAIITVHLYGGKSGTASFDIKKELKLDLQAREGKSYSFQWDYASAPGYTKDFNWAQFAIVKTISTGTLSPIYIDHMQLLPSSMESEKPTPPFSINDWNLIWNDEFSGDIGQAPAKHWKPGALWNKNGMWRDATLEPKEAYLDGKGNLVMRTRYTNGKRLAPYLVTSEAGTYPKQESLTFGPGDKGIYIEWRANVSEFKAFAAWFALWLFADNPYSGDPAVGSEIDLMEYVPFVCDNYTLMNKFNAAVHLADNNTKTVNPPTPYGHTQFDPNTWHTWGLEWYKDQQVFYLDGKPYWINKQYVSTSNTHGLRMTIEIANGLSENGNKNGWGHPVGNFEDNPTTRLPSCAYIDYVRIYRKK